MFQLITDTDVTLVHVNMRTEKHGNADVDAYDLDFAIEGPNNKVLGLLHPDLCDCLYFEPEEEQGQQTLEEVRTVPRHLRFKKLGDLPWQEDATGVDLRIQYGLGDLESNIALDDGKASTRKVQAKDGGTAVLFFRFSTSAMPDGVLDKLRKLLKSTVTITMVRPEKLREDAVIDGSKGHPGAAASAEAKADRKTGDMFDGDDGPEAAGDDPEAVSDHHAGDFGTDHDDDGSPATSDTAAFASEVQRGGENWPFPDGQADAGGDAGQAEPDPAKEAADFEAGLQKELAAAGMKPKARGPAANDAAPKGRRTRRAANGGLE